MILTRSIRRKMSLGLVAVTVMLVIMAGGVLSGLHWYQRSIDDLDFTIRQVPHRSALSEAVAGLFEPVLPLATQRSARSPRSARFRASLEQTRKAVADYRRKLDALPLSPEVNAYRPVSTAILADVDRRLARLDTVGERLDDATPNDRTTSQVLRELAVLETQIRQLPDSRVGLSRALASARDDYRARIWGVGGSAAVVVVLFLGLVFAGYRWIFAPIRVLHRGASRVANGDFDYRVDLKTNDEMSELAEAFNKMTRRFQEIKNDLDRQVEERSRQLVRSERLANVGILAAGVAHEINNPLSAICMAAESLRNRMAETDGTIPEEDRPVVQQYLQMIGSESVRCRQITARLLDFSRGDETVRLPTDLSAVVSEVVALTGHLSKFRDRRIVFTPSEPALAEVNPAEMKQVVLNLVANGLEATEPGGSLTISIEELTDHLILSFRDEGCGMSPEVLDAIFEPFFTQRKGGGGTGLGLSITHRIVHEHGGRIEALSDGPGQGSTFRVHLPKSAVQAAAA